MCHLTDVNDLQSTWKENVVAIYRVYSTPVDIPHTL